ncbi:MAG: hypothetical protein D3903_12755, partial [Candidatus Electrothrix sp. GM3_4]|nr:hypothetical protein [Candidatus Electrothrix sp. GM3_4]
SGIPGLDSGGGQSDQTAMGGIYVEREEFSLNTAAIALYRYFLEPLGVSVDKWSMGVRGRSRTYSFADQFDLDRLPPFGKSYTATFITELGASLGVATLSIREQKKIMSQPLTEQLTEQQRMDQLAAVCEPIIKDFVNPQLVTVEGIGAEATPHYTDIQRIFNKSCIECHGGLNYPPVKNSLRGNFDLSEDEDPLAGQGRLWRSLKKAESLISAPTCGVPCTSAAATNVDNSNLFNRITDYGKLKHPYGLYNINGSNEDCISRGFPRGLMPCGGPPLSLTDIKTVKRWIVGSFPTIEGDPHIRTVDGVNYDFPSTGEFVLLRDAGMELQARQSAVSTAGPSRPNAHTGLSSCVSLITAVAMRVGEHRITYQPILNPQSNSKFSTNKSSSQSARLQLRIDGKPVLLGEGARIPLRERWSHCIHQQSGWARSSISGGHANRNCPILLGAPPAPLHEHKRLSRSGYRRYYGCDCTKELAPKII